MGICDIWARDHLAPSKLGDGRTELRLNGRDRKRCHNEMGVGRDLEMYVWQSTKNGLYL